MSHKITISKIENNSKNLIELDSDKFDLKITLNEFNQISEKSDVLKKVCGDPHAIEWAVFKEKFIEYQKEFGFEWVPVQGYGGPIGLKSVELFEEIGSELALKLLREKVKGGNFMDTLAHNLPFLFRYISDKLNILEVTPAKEAFKYINLENEIFKFSVGRNSQKFIRATREYSFKSKESRQHEVAFGELIIEKIKKLLYLDVLEHSQLDRDKGKYQNADFEGFKVYRGINSDDYHMYNFELKPSNNISSVSESISQAINYKEMANFTYIVIPNFDSNSFYNSDRYSDLFELCKSNQIGIISIEMDTNQHTVSDVSEVLPAQQTNLDENRSLKKMIEESEFDRCPLCHRIVTKGENKRNECGWKLTINDEVKCMKDIMEKGFTQALDRRD